MKTRQVLGFGMFLIVGLIIGMVAIYNIPISFAARQSETASPVPTVLLPTAAPAFQSPIPGASFSVIAAPTQIRRCTFDPAAPPPSAGVSLESFTFSEPEVVLKSDTGVQLFQWLPDNQRLLLSRRMMESSRQYIETFDLDTRETKRYAEWNGTQRGVIWLPTEEAVAFVDVIPPDYTETFVQPLQWVPSDIWCSYVPAVVR